MWGTSWRQRLRLAPLYVAMAAADGIAALLPAARPPRYGRWGPGISVIIPERDAPAMLAEALASLHGALARVDEPWQVIVVANGAPQAAYGEVRARFPDVEWIHVEAPLGFAGAIERGLRRARHDGTFLLNNDMTLDAEAIASLLPLRDADVFAIGSQILQQDAAGRREETGFTDWYIARDGVHLYHAPVPAAADAATQLCASGGAALFRTERLRHYIADSRCYDPFYWEDVEWSLRAWRDGLRVLFSPVSRVAHRHRATTARFYTKDAIDRIVERNRALFDARHGITRFGRAWSMNRICELPYASQRELARIEQAAGVFRQRIARARKPQPLPPPSLAGRQGESFALQPSSYSYRLRTATTAQPARARLLLVTPFAVFPPRHGGARRVAELLRGLRGSFDIMLVTDEASLYDARSFADFTDLCAVTFVQREETTPGLETSLLERMRTHCHPALIAAVDAAQRSFRPDLVQVEHAELAETVRCRLPGSRWILDLHDAYGSADFGEAEDAARFAQCVSAYDAIAVCSDEDGALVSHPRVVTVPNGANIAAANYHPSDSARLLFVGPFRYGPNREGILRFLREAWPAIRKAVPSATLLVLGGDEHVTLGAFDPAFTQPGVEVVGHRDDVPRLLAESALTINPLSGIRGSAVKLVESLAAGRVCVSTTEGARGFRAAVPPGLLTVPDVAAMIDPIVALLVDTQRRHRLETAAHELLPTFAWSRVVARQQALYDALLDRREGDSP